MLGVGGVSVVAGWCLLGLLLWWSLASPESRGTSVEISLPEEAGVVRLGLPGAPEVVLSRTAWEVTLPVPASAAAHLTWWPGQGGRVVVEVWDRRWVVDPEDGRVARVHVLGPRAWLVPVEGAEEVRVAPSVPGGWPPEGQVPLGTLSWSPQGASWTPNTRVGQRSPKP